MTDLDINTPELSKQVYSVDLGHMIVATLEHSPEAALVSAELWGQDNARRFDLDPSRCSGTLDDITLLHRADVAQTLVHDAAVKYPHLLGFKNSF